MEKKIVNALNDQLNAEFFSAYLYFSMASYFRDNNLSGFTHWMEVQVQEELVHCQKISTYIADRRGRVSLDSIKKPQHDWKSPLDALEAAFDHERMISKRINDLVKLTVDENDNATYNFLQWFVSEQVEEEATVDSIVQNLKLIDGFGPGLFMLDKDMHSRSPQD